MDANGTAIIIAAVFLGLQQLLQMYLSYRRDMRAADKVEEVKTNLVETTLYQSNRTDEVISKLEDNTAKTQMVVEQTNGINASLKSEISGLRQELKLKTEEVKNKDTQLKHNQ